MHSAKNLRINLKMMPFLYSSSTTVIIRGLGLNTLKSLIGEQTGINEQTWKKVPPCLLIY